MKEFPFEKYKFYRDGNRVIAASTFAGKTVRGVAICASNDEFDLEKGKHIAAARCNKKIAEKRLAFARKKQAEMENFMYRMDRKLAHSIDYHNDSYVAYLKATQELDSLLGLED